MLLENILKKMLERYEIREIANSPERKIKELYDIESIVEKFKNNIKWEIIKEYFEIFELKNEFEEIFKKYGNFK